MAPSFYIFNYLFKPFLKFYLKFNSSVRFNNLKVKVNKGVFHPKLFFSTSYLYDFLSQKNLQSKSFLEIGSGTGVLSLLAYQKGAKVTAVDIDENAIQNTQSNFDLNFGKNHPATIIKSNLFKELEPQVFEVVVINPPYFFKKIESSSQQAWYCGQEGEYFEELFSKFSEFTDKNSLVIMILAENCDIKRIQNIASNHQLHFNLLEQKKIMWEMNYIYQILQN
jgi:release factor glutamine methyltransferase